ncbi:MAG: hypothetical protein EU551_04440 [Promethearchaeota archaeon]|nr:MAG: hypothetical protein EU551_04440 [Candidatus Lokiarchaeota archaeon]
MRANLHSRKNIRLKWFELKDISFEIKRKLEISYSTSTVENNINNFSPLMEYNFKGGKDIPQSDIIIFENGLPAAYAKTVGSKGDKFSTEPQLDPIVNIKDRIVELSKGKETISREPPTYPNPRVKEIEIRDREDSIKRKITFENDSTERIEFFELKLIETKDVRFTNSSPEPNKRDPPEYLWNFSINPEEAFSIELEFQTHIRKTFEIEKEPPSNRDRDRAH